MKDPTMRKLFLNALSESHRREGDIRMEMINKIRKEKDFRAGLMKRFGDGIPERTGSCAACGFDHEIFLVCDPDGRFRSEIENHCQICGAVCCADEFCECGADCQA